jgi:DNA-binding GntR family transcriptional regulator
MTDTAAATVPAPTGTETPAPDTTDAVFRVLRRRILSLELPPGEPVSERGLESHVGASRTPVRAAMVRLEADGLMRRVGRGWIVAPLDIDEIEQLGAYREALETAAVRIVAEHPDRVALAALAAESHHEDAPSNADALDAARDFHSRLAGLSGNRFLADGVRHALTRLERARWLEVEDAESRARSAAEHAAILQAVSEGDGDRAAQLVAEHARDARTRAIAVLGSDRARGLKVLGGRGADDAR